MKRFFRKYLIRLLLLSPVLLFFSFFIPFFKPEIRAEMRKLEASNQNYYRSVGVHSWGSSLGGSPLWFDTSGLDYVSLCGFIGGKEEYVDNRIRVHHDVESKNIFKRYLVNEVSVKEPSYSSGRRGTSKDRAREQYEEHFYKAFKTGEFEGVLFYLDETVNTLFITDRAGPGFCSYRFLKDYTIQKSEKHLSIVSAQPWSWPWLGVYLPYFKVESDTARDQP